MKIILPFFIFLVTANCKAQKYALLDEHLYQPVVFADKVTSTDKYNDFFPVEKKMIHQFVDVLEEIQNQLSSKKSFVQAKQYEVGCAKFIGLNVHTNFEERLDYVLISSCDNIKISMHLSDAKISNANNSYFIKTWIRYIRSYLKGS